MRVSLYTGTDHNSCILIASLGNYNSTDMDYRSPWERQHKMKETWTSMTQMH